jgi:hypothetical protein
MSNTNDIGIYQLKLNIRSLIPKQDKLVLTSDMLNYEGQSPIEKYPFFSAVHKYPRKKLQDMSYDKLIEFFFNLDVFRTKLKRRKVVHTKGNSGKKRMEGGNRKYNTPAEILTLKQSNFILMLQLLFPTVYPITNNIDTSIGIITQKPEEEEEEGDTGDAAAGEEEEENFEEISPEENKKTNKKTNSPESGSGSGPGSGSFFDFQNIQSFFSLKGTSIFNFLPSRFDRKFSYLKIGGQEYTITRTIWLNDVMNHPVYSDVIKAYHLFEIWKDTKKEIQDVKEKWNIVLFALDTSFKTPNLFEKMHEEGNKYYNNPDNRRNNSDFENMKDFDDMIEKIRSNRLLIFDPNFQNQSKTDKDRIYKQKRKELFNTFKNNQEIYNFLEKLTVLLKRIKNSRITGTFTSFLNNVTTKISNFNKDKSYEDYVNNLNFEYLSNPELSGVADKIRTKYPEFNNFVNKIQNMKVRIIDNVIWKQVIASIIKGSKYHNFQTKIWNKIDACYGLNAEEEEDVSDDEEGDEEEEEEEEENEEEKKKKKEEMKNKKIGKCSSSEKVFYVNFDQLIEKDPNGLPDMKIIDIFLQMDVIEGKIDDNNKNAINCDYTNTDLGNTWEKLVNGVYSWDLTQQMFFYSAKKQLELYNQKQKNPTSGDTNIVKK